jgi:peptide/nickel transport system permease protein
MSIIRQLGWKIPNLALVVVGVSLLTFLLINALPGNVAVAILGDQATPEQVAALTQQMGLDRPVAIRYLEWFQNAIGGDFGTSLTSGQSVWGAVAERVPATLQLVVMAVVLAVIGAIPAATLAVRRPGGIMDRLLGAVSFGLLATPAFLVGLLLILVFPVTLGIFPVSGWTSFADDPLGNLESSILPALTLAATPFAFYSRLLRGDMLEQLARQDYVTTARAKGVGQVQILLKHVLRNSIFPLMTMIGLTTSLLVGGSVVVETIFGVPGVGQLLIQSITARDVTVVLGVVVFIALTVVIVNVLVDILYGVVDPRIRHEYRDN